MVTVYIAYPGDGKTRFDRAYYAAHHLPLVLHCWREYGLGDLAVFYPESDGNGTIAICACTFSDDAAVVASFSSARTPEVMQDIPNFTDARPFQYRAVPLRSHGSVGASEGRADR